MKNALIIFAATLPFLILNQLIYSGQSQILGLLILITPISTLSFLLYKTHLDFPRELIIRKVFKSFLVAGSFYAIWMGLYQFLVVNYLNPEYGQFIISEYNKLLLDFPLQNRDEVSQALPNLFTKPLYWIFSHLLNNFFFFSPFGLILGMLFKFKLAKQ